ncbi:uncharacterized protein LOC130015097 [Mercurialis annua]|uniref:uncharacterized protein LOC130015097 n=1 Tax=Mercurialis annua TaxID=3986 RepID=UPI0024ACB63F|nr:uncharacterized protein LOC130015097 [Mercurialis annua]
MIEKYDKTKIITSTYDGKGINSHVQHVHWSEMDKVIEKHWNRNNEIIKKHNKERKGLHRTMVKPLAYEFKLRKHHILSQEIDQIRHLHQVHGRKFQSVISSSFEVRLRRFLRPRNGDGKLYTYTPINQGYCELVLRSLMVILGARTIWFDEQSRLDEATTNGTRNLQNATSLS